ncbi:hypothetical protein K2X30_05975 [bacterium]|nr:hypothetical protein [bacterium]
MKKVAIIANRQAGGGSAAEAIRQAQRSLWGWDFEYHFPKSLSEMASICESLGSHTHEAAVIVGGDGTVNQALRGLIKSQVPLCVYPGGTANDLAADLGLKKDWSQVQRLLDSRETDLIDLIEVNGVPFSTVAGIGIGSILTSEFNRKRKGSAIYSALSKRLHSHLYSFLSVKTILMRSDYHFDLRIRSDIFDEKVRSAAVFICNQSKLGGDLRVAHHRVENDDQKFSVLVVPKCGTLRLMRGLVELRLGKMPKDFIAFSTDRLSIQETQGRNIPVFGDGDILVESSKLEFKIAPRALRIYREGNA